MTIFADNTRYMEDGCDANEFEIVECANCLRKDKLYRMIEDEMWNELYFCDHDCQKEFDAKSCAALNRFGE